MYKGVGVSLCYIFNGHCKIANFHEFEEKHWMILSAKGVGSVHCALWMLFVCLI